MERDGLRIAYLDWGDPSSDVAVDPLIVLHPNGFCAGVFDPLARRLGDRFRVVGVDLRGHGASETGTVPALLGNDAMALDVLAVADELEVDHFHLLGVSLGGGVAIEVASAAPERVRALMLCEAIAIDSTAREQQHFSFGDGEHPLAVGARRRRAVWPDRATIVESYGARPPLAAMAPEALAAYVRWGFVDRPDGQVELACAPETEAAVFDSGDRHGPTHTFERLVDIVCPVSVLAGTDTDLARTWFGAQADLLGVDLTLVDGGHFFLFEDLERGSVLIREHLG